MLSHDRQEIRCADSSPFKEDVRAVRGAVSRQPVAIYSLESASFTESTLSRGTENYASRQIKALSFGLDTGLRCSSIFTPERHTGPGHGLAGTAFQLDISPSGVCPPPVTGAGP